MGNLLTNTSGSLWMLLDGLTDYPLNGQGSVTGTAGSSLTANASAGRPVILEAVEVESCSVAGTVVLARDDAGAITTLQVPTSAATQKFNLGGPHGILVTDGFNATSTGTLVGIKIYFRFPA